MSVMESVFDPYSMQNLKVHGVPLDILKIRHTGKLILLDHKFLTVAPKSIYVFALDYFD